MQAEYDYLFKILIIGDQGVGKTALLSRFTRDEFNQNYCGTIGIEFATKTINIDGKAIKLQIWDTAGHERFRSITSAYYAKTQGVLLCYECTNRETFDNVSKWFKEAEAACEPNTPKVLIANKIDLSNREVSKDEGQSLADRLGMKYVEVSAASDVNVKEVFDSVIKSILSVFLEKKSGWWDTSASK